MKKSQRKYANEHPSGDYLLKCKDAVKICVGILEDFTEIDESDIDWIYDLFEKKCYANSNRWEISK